MKSKRHYQLIDLMTSKVIGTSESKAEIEFMASLAKVLGYKRVAIEEVIKWNM